MILLDKMKEVLPVFRPMADKAICLRIHKDVIDLAYELVIRDEAKLRAAMTNLFMPAEECWFEWGAQEGDFGLMFAGMPTVKSGNAVFYSWKHGDRKPWSAIGLKIDFDKGLMEADMRQVTEGDPIQLAQAANNIKPVILAVLALINSPKIVRRQKANLDRLNRKRESAGRYTYHPHHTVRLNIDRKSIVVREGHGGDGATRPLHFVRAHLRLWKGIYILVTPHWRGDPAVGIRNTSYEIDRQTSVWKS